MFHVYELNKQILEALVFHVWPGVSGFNEDAS
jgi:hypothetical protein